MVESILSQSFRDFELLLIDDGSTDNTLRNLRDIAATDDRVKIHTKNNGGPSSARNLGLEKAAGQYIQFFDSDDNIAANALEIIIDAIKQNDSDVLVSGWQIDLQTPKKLRFNYKQVRPEPTIITKDIRTYILRSVGSSGTLYNLWNKLFRADIIRNHNLRFREDLRFGEDVLFALEYFNYIRNLRIISDVTYHYQTNSETSVFSSSSIVAKYREINDEAIVQFAGKKPSVAEYSLLQWIRWRWLVSYWSLVAGSSKKFGEKLDLIKQFRPPELKTARLMHIGIKKYLIQCTIFLARPTAVGALLLGKTVDTLRDIVRFIKTI